MSEFPMLDRCDEKAKTMPHFTIVASDPLCEPLIRMWHSMAELIGVPRDKCNEAHAIAEKVWQWRINNDTDCKIPD
jgi:hypothetical protein